MNQVGRDTYLYIMVKIINNFGYESSFKLKAIDFINFK